AKCFGDGSLFVVNFACRLLAEAIEPGGSWEGGVGKEMGGGAQVTREGFALALQWSLEYLNDPTCPVRVPLPQGKSEETSTKSEEASAKSEKTPVESTTDASAAAQHLERVMVALAVGVLGSKAVCRLRPQECRRLSELAVEAFLGSRGFGDDGQMVSNVRVLPMLGPSCSDSEVIENAVLLETPLPPPCRRPHPSSTTTFPEAHRQPPPPAAAGGQAMASRMTTLNSVPARLKNLSTQDPYPSRKPGDVPRMSPDDHTSLKHLSTQDPYQPRKPGDVPRMSPDDHTWLKHLSTQDPYQPRKPGDVTRMSPEDHKSQKEKPGDVSRMSPDDHKAQTEKPGSVPRMSPDDHKSQIETAKAAAAGGTARGRGCWAAQNRPVSVALFEASLQMETRDPFDPDHDSGLRAEFSSDANNGGSQDFGHSDSDSEWTAGGRELQELEAFARALVDVGAGIVACQRVIHPYLKKRLAENGVVALERLSALNITSFQSVTGARLIGSWLGPEPIRRADLGAAGLLTVRRLHGRPFLEVGSASRAALTSLRSSIDVSAVRKRRRPVSTLVLCAPDRPALDELQVTTDGLMLVLTQTALEGGVALAGAGCWEVMMSTAACY
ncbi:unnamed protein product, partial [Laminaria digitata]